MDLYRRIKARREELEMTQEELSKILGYKSRSSVNKIEMGENDIPQSKIKAFADALRTTPAYLMGWTDDPVDYDDPELIADVSGPVLDHFDGDVKKAFKAKKAIDEDALNEVFPSLTKKDERSIQKRLEDMMDDLMPGTGSIAYYDDEEPMSDEDKELLRISLENTLRLAKQMAKQKFTPKKYRK